MGIVFELAKTKIVVDFSDCWDNCEIQSDGYIPARTGGRIEEGVTMDLGACLVLFWQTK